MQFAARNAGAMFERDPSAVRLVAAVEPILYQPSLGKLLAEQT
jgi:hypothetical protein